MLNDLPNNLCRDKYRRLGLAWRFGETSLLSSEALAAYETLARGSGVEPGIVFATGATGDRAAREREEVEKGLV